MIRWAAEGAAARRWLTLAVALALGVWGCDGNPDAQVPQELREASTPETKQDPGARIDYASDLEQTKYVYRKVIDQARKEITSVKIARSRLSMLDGQIEQERELMR